ncbi:MULTISPECIES: ADP-ribose diphosphatase [Gilliamella]|uniref:ADP-ribose pyrophosphatase n=1 Tax=Gilliamella apis TaxID=1970738 RepID=A0A242NWQ0_9GAMM|nr:MULTISPECIES: ADP-ribose diphosphatase [Gilliamella]KES16240.1 NTP pyrophosphohydrolase including oxidative damage repair enzyme [Gilliamella apis SCGC AB-598-P17]MBI0059825.1 ADP-ribose diphosphatase [Gilliamella sp. M0320]MBI0113077.1 ADP-ribose diphosphatase [Gilliamella sp. W8123]MBI0116715.1 ADP-ribose diphosphatase [Gilliamella sp. W8129]MBI0153287.1 ADP-ribose diphosphatase [Gilliamella sp. W8128]
MKYKPTPVIFNKKDVFNLTKRILYKGFFSLFEYRFQYRKFDGSVSEMVSREILERGHAVVLLAYDDKRDEVVLIEQIRIAAIDTQASPWILELIAGMMDHENESTEEVARREAMEEAGIVIGQCKPIISYLASPGGLTEQLHILVGQVDSSTAKGVHGLAEENEDIKVHVVSREQAYKWVEEGVINNAASIIALQWLQLNHLTLKNEWK